jgi:hypothetical protein
LSTHRTPRGDFSTAYYQKTLKNISIETLQHSTLGQARLQGRTFGGRHHQQKPLCAMAPSFLKDLRRRSKASFLTSKSDVSEGSAGSIESVPTSKSSSTLNTTYGSHTPPSQGIDNPSSYSDFQTQTDKRQSYSKVNGFNSSKRNSSVSGMSGLGSPASAGLNSLPVSPYAPRIASVQDGAWVYGTIGDSGAQNVEGNLTVCRADDEFPPINWPVFGSNFKALVYLNPGPNKLRFDFSSPRLPNSNLSNNIHTTHITVHMMPITNSPPLQLAILLAKDSPETFDSTPGRVEKEGNNLAVAVKKFRMAAYLWQAFTAEQMWRNRLGRRVFRFEEEWQPGTSCFRDHESGTMRNEAKIHIIRCNRSGD